LLAYGNANQIVLEMAPEVLSVVKRTPVLAGVCGTDPFLLRSHFLKELRDLGFSGIQNFPTVGLIDGRFRANLEETGMSFALEIECIAEAHAMDFLTTPYVFDPEQARRMTEAGADIVVAHMGLTTSGTICATTAKSLTQCVDEIRRIADAAKSHRQDVLVLCHGGPIAMPEDVRFILGRCPEIDGFYGASSMERLLTEAAISEQVRRFADVKLGRPGVKSPTRRGRTDPTDSASQAGNNLHPIGVE
jgi:predicted TIM-barrel enzyme